MASDGGGKLRTKKNRNYKPYERQKTFFQSVKDKVNKVFPVSWLASWAPSNTEDPPPLVAHGSTTRTNSNDAWDRDGNCVRRNPNCESQIPNALSQLNGDESSEEVDDVNSLQTEAMSESSLSKLKGALGRLAHDGQFARKTHSLLHTDDTDKSSDEGGARSSTPVWSYGLPNALPQPCASSAGLGGTPMFNPSRFRSSLPSSARSSLSDLSGKESPFYGGRTTYGGASSRTASLLSRAPYQLNRSRTVKVKQVNADSTEDLTGLSRTAQNILKTLEKMSTPVRDAQRIPPPLTTHTTNNAELIEQLCRTPTLRHRPKLFNRSITDRKSGPPVAHLGTPTPVTIRKASLRTTPKPTFNESFKPSTSLPTRDSESRQSKTTGKMRAKITSTRHSRAQQEEDEYLEEPDLPNVPLPITNLPAFSFLSKEPVLPAVVASSSISNSNAASFKFSSPLPVDQASDATKLPTDGKSFTFSSPLPFKKSNMDSKLFCGFPPKPSETSDSDKSDSDTDVLNKSSSLQTEGDSDSDDSISEKEDAAPVPATGFGDLFKKPPGSWSCGECWIQNKSEDKKCVACQTPKPEPKKPEVACGSVVEKSSSAPISGFGDKFKKPVDSWTCDTCWVTNDSDKKCCVACQTDKPASDPKPKNTSGDFKFGSQPAESLDKNKIKGDADRSSSCQNSSTTSGVTGFGDKFKKEVGSWTCDSCLVVNKKECTRCVCCDTANPGAVTSEAAKETSGFGDAFKKKMGEWTCDTCYVLNTEKNMTCVACEALKPGTKAGKKESWNCNTCFVSNEDDATRCKACSAPKEPKKASVFPSFTFSSSCGNKGKFTFGSSATAAAPSAVASEAPTGFKFGENQFGTKDEGSSKDKQESVGGFKFGSTSLPDTKTPTGFQFGASDAKDVAKPQQAEQPGGFKFGASALPATGFQFGASNASEPQPGKGFQLGAPSKDTGTASTEQSNIFGAVKPAPEMKSGSVLDFLSKKDNLLKSDTSAPAEKQPPAEAKDPPKAVFTFGAKSSVQAPADVNVAVTLPLVQPPLGEKRTRPDEGRGPAEAKKPAFGSLASDGTEKKNLFVFGSPAVSQGGGFGSPAGGGTNVGFGVAGAATPMFGSGSTPSFGSASAAQPLTGFGETTKQPATKTAFGDGKDAAPSNLFTFGSSATKPATFGENSSSTMSFGSSGASNPTPSFGGFGTSNTATPPAPSTGFNFGAAPTQPTFQFSAGTSNTASQPNAGATSFPPAQSTTGFNQSNAGFNFVPGAPNLNFANTANPGQTFTFSASPSTPQQQQRVFKRAHRRIKK